MYCCQHLSHALHKSLTVLVVTTQFGFASKLFSEIDTYLFKQCIDSVGINRYNRCIPLFDHHSKIRNVYM